MRRLTCILLVVLTIALLTSTAVIGSAAEFTPVVFEDAVQVHNGGTYPRMTLLNNGALEYYYQSGYKYSLNSGESFSTAISTTKNAKSTVDVDGTTHALVRENHHALELSDGTVMMAYRSLTKGYVNDQGEVVSAKTVNGKFYSSIRVVTRPNYTAEYDNEQIIIENVYNSTNDERCGFWEPFLIQLDDTTVAMYYADDFSPADSGANQYIMVILYDIKTGTWGEPTIAVNEEKTMGREGMPMVARLVDGNYVMAVESHCLQQSRKYIFVVRLWFSQDGINWDKGVVVAAPGALNLIPSYASLDYWCAAPCVTVLPDGRIAVSYQDNYAGKDDRTYKPDDKTYNAMPCIILSKDKITYENAGNISSSTKGVSSSFTSLASGFTNHSTISDSIKNDIYGIWNSTFYANGYLYFCSSLGYNTSDTTRTALGTYLCRALVDESAVPDEKKTAQRYGTLEVNNPEKLLRIMNDSTMWNKDIVLTADIDLSKSVYDASRGFAQTPIGYLNTAKFTGSFDGQGHTINGLNIQNTVSANKTGLFGYCDGATIKNCTLYGTVTSSGDYCGSFAGYSQNSHFANLTSYVSVSGTTHVGGIAGRMLGGSVGGSFNNCVNRGAVSASSNSVGGIVGMIDTNTGAAKNTTFTDCANYGSVSGATSIGGLIGQINHLTTKGCTVSVTGCVNNGAVTSSATNSSAGGIVGQYIVGTVSASTNGVFTISDCENNAKITGKQNVGGIVGRMHSGVSQNTVSECENNGVISGTSTSVGGIVGKLDTVAASARKTTVSSCTNRASVSSSNYVGGIVGYINHLTENASEVELLDCVNHGAISATADSSCVAGIVGQTAIVPASGSTAEKCNGAVTFDGCENYGPITGRSYVAGIAANVNLENSSANGKLYLSECKNYAQIGDSNATTRVAGIIGRILGTKNCRAEINLCYNEGNIVSGSSGKDVGGIIAVAKYADIADCESRCDITTQNTTVANMGGIIGLTNTDVTVSRCYYTGNTAQNPIAGTSPDCTSNNNYYYVDSSITDEDGAFVELNKGEAYYPGFDFDNVWYATVLGPRLRYGKTFIKGDVNGNGRVDIADPIIIQRYLAKWDGYAEYIVYDSADVYNLGTIDICDAVYIVRHLAGWVGYEDLGTN